MPTAWCQAPTVVIRHCAQQSHVHTLLPTELLYSCSYSSHELEESEPKVLFTPMPIIWMLPQEVGGPCQQGVAGPPATALCSPACQSAPGRSSSCTVASHDASSAPLFA
jgi:hypothetical protein